MAGEEELHRHIGKVEGRLDALEKDVEAIQSDLKEALNRIHSRLDGIAEAITAGKSAWKTITIIATVLVSLAGGAGWVIDKTEKAITRLEQSSSSHNQAPAVPPKSQP